MNNKFIYEMPVYCGRLKVWRVLNIFSGSIYSMDFETFEEAMASIQDGTMRCGMVVKAVTIPIVAAILNQFYE